MSVAQTFVDARKPRRIILQFLNIPCRKKKKNAGSGFGHSNIAGSTEANFDTYSCTPSYFQRRSVILGFLSLRRFWWLPTETIRRYPRKFLGRAQMTPKLRSCDTHFSTFTASTPRCPISLMIRLPHQGPTKNRSYDMSDSSLALCQGPLTGHWWTKERRHIMNFHHVAHRVD